MRVRHALRQIAGVTLLGLALPVAAAAQFGHPLVGQWTGDWGSRDKPTRILLNLTWDGTAVSGEVNPGPNALKITRTTIDYSDPASWVVKMAAEGTSAGKPVSVTVDGRLENIGVYRRIFRGTWTQNGQKGEFVVTRN